MLLSEKILMLRKKQGWSQEELAEKLGVSRQSVSKWESTGSVPDLQKVIQLAELFGVSTDYLLFGVERGLENGFYMTLDGKSEEQKKYLEKLLQAAADNLKILE